MVSRSAALCLPLAFLGAACLAEPAPAPKEAAFDAANSFRGMAFGTPLEQAKQAWELQPVAEEGQVPERLQLFIRNDEKKSLGDISVQELGYYFFDGKFYGVVIGTMESRHTELLKRMFEAAYTSGPQVSSSAGAFVWPGRNVSVLMKINADTGEARTLVFGNGMQREYEDFAREAARKAAEGL